MDNIDRKILLALQKNGRSSNAELARELGMAASTMLERIRRLEERGILRGYRAMVDPNALDLTVQAFVSVSLDRHITKYVRKLEEEVHKIPHVVACYHVTGRFDYLLHVVARDLEHLGKVVKEQIAAISGIGKIETFLVFSEVKGNGGLPIEEDTQKL